MILDAFTDHLAARLTWMTAHSSLEVPTSALLFQLNTKVCDYNVHGPMANVSNPAKNV